MLSRTRDRRADPAGRDGVRDARHPAPARPRREAHGDPSDLRVVTQDTNVPTSPCVVICFISPCFTSFGSTNSSFGSSQVRRLCLSWRVIVCSVRRCHRAGHSWADPLLSGETWGVPGVVGHFDDLLFRIRIEDAESAPAIGSKYRVAVQRHPAVRDEVLSRLHHTHAELHGLAGVTEHVIQRQRFAKTRSRKNRQREQPQRRHATHDADGRVDFGRCIGPLCAPLWEFRTRGAPHSGPRRAARAEAGVPAAHACAVGWKEILATSQGLRGDIKGRSPWLVRAGVWGRSARGRS